VLRLFEPLFLELSLSVWRVQVRKKKAGRKKEKSQEVYMSRMREVTPIGRSSTKLGKCR